MALADVYDALVSKRVYKSALPHDTAKSIILAERNKHFSADIIDGFLEAEDKFISILETYKV